MSRLYSIIAILSVFLTGCSPKMSAVWEKNDYLINPLYKIAVIVIDNNLEVRQALESSLVKELSKTYPTKIFMPGLDIIPPNAEEDQWQAENIEDKLEKMKVNGVISVCVVDSYYADRLRSGHQIAYPVYRRVGNKIYGTYQYITTPDYYEQETNYVLQCALYDLSLGKGKEDNMYWVGTSSVSNPTTVLSGASNYAKNLIKYIKSKELIK